MDGFMRLRLGTITLLAALALSGLGGCSNDETQAGDNTGRPCLGAGSVACTTTTVQEPQQSTIDDPEFDASFRCQATPDRQTAYPGELVQVDVSVTGRTGPFYVDGFSGILFGSSFSLRGSYTDPGADKAMTRVFYVTDSNDTSKRAKCSFPITVKTYNSTGSSALACTLTATPTTASPNVPVELKVTLTGATRPVALEIWPAPHWKLDWNDVRLVSSTEVRASVSYPTAGPRSPYAYVSDGVTSAICNATVNVYSPVLTLQAAPSASAYPSQTITLGASVAGFPTTPDLSFTTSEPGISIAVNGVNATVRNTDGMPHNFRVTAHASKGTLEQTATIDLQFLPAASSALACQLNATVRPFVGDGELYSFAVAPGSPTNEVLYKFDYQLPSDATVLENANDHLRIRFSQPGTKLVRVRAYGASTYTLCNGDGWIQLPVVVVDHLATRGCTVTLSQGSSKLLDPLTAQAAVDATAGRGPFRLEDLAIDNSTPYFWDLGVEAVPGQPRPGNNLLALAVRFFKSAGGNVSTDTWVTYRARVVDLGDTSSQDETTCASTHTVRPQ